MRKSSDTVPVTGKISRYPGIPIKITGMEIVLKKNFIPNSSVIICAIFQELVGSQLHPVRFINYLYLPLLDGNSEAAILA